MSEAYLSGCAQTLPVYDFATGGTHMSAIMREESIPAYGTLYLCDVPDVGPVSVILSAGVQFTLSDWQGEQVMTADEIADPPHGHWVAGRGTDAIMLAGLRRILAYSPTNQKAGDISPASFIPFCYDRRARSFFSRSGCLARRCAPSS